MKLTPPVGPRRGYLKARSFHAEIANLRGEGYSCEQIRQALATAGVVVSKSTMQREVSNLARLPDAHGRQRSARPPDPAPSRSSSPPVAPPTPVALSGGKHYGKDIAEAFFKDRITNPFFLRRKSP